MFFEDPALLIGIPFALIGVFGLLIAMATLFAPKPALAGNVPQHAHPTEAQYVKVGLFLGAITAIEVVIYYFNIPRGVFITMLLSLSVVKFAVVVLWFMHLKFDSRIFTTAFVTGLVLASGLFTVVIVTLGSNLV